MQLAVNAMFWTALVSGIGAVAGAIVTVAGATGAVASVARPVVKRLFPEQRPVFYEEDENEY